MVSTLCHRTIAVGEASPFGKIIALTYDDGPTGGAVACRSCALAYRFERLHTDVDGVYDRAAWDIGEELHVFGLAPLPANAFDRIVTRLSEVEPPRWPVWTPGMPSTSDDLERIVERGVVPLLEEAGPWQVIVAGAGLQRPFVAVRHTDRAHVPADGEWFAWLGLAPQSEPTLVESGRA